MEGIFHKLFPHQQKPWVVAAALFFGNCAPLAAENIYISKVAAYADTARVREEVHDECKPDALLPAMMREEVLKRTSIGDVMFTDEPIGTIKGLAMELSILTVKTPPATSWTNEMRVLKVKSAIYRDGNMVGEYVRNAKTPGGGHLLKKAFKNSNSCQILERLARDISEQTVERFKLMKLLPEVMPK